jgi:DNA-3-methyladenine glycosylase
VIAADSGVRLHDPVRELWETLARSVHDAARALVGWTLLLDGVGGIVVETEAYARDDPASHSFRGPTGRTNVMFGPPGYLYVYRSYGVHWCANVVCEPVGTGAAVLLRALEPTAGIPEMRRRRGIDDARLLCSGPGRLTQALGLTGEHDGSRLDREPFELQPPAAPVSIVTGPRIGISKAVGVPWRYALAGSGFVSPPRPRG